MNTAPDVVNIHEVVQTGQPHKAHLIRYCINAANPRFTRQASCALSDGHTLKYLYV
jgi:peptide methionine sulfoxide reductase MsrB